jgi:hypothetical protein
MTAAGIGAANGFEKQMQDRYSSTIASRLNDCPEVLENSGMTEAHF